MDCSIETLSTRTTGGHPLGWSIIVDTQNYPTSNWLLIPPSIHILDPASPSPMSNCPTPMTTIIGLAPTFKLIRFMAAVAQENSLADRTTQLTSIQQTTSKQRRVTMRLHSRRLGSGSRIEILMSDSALGLHRVDVEWCGFNRWHLANDWEKSSFRC